MPSRYEVPSFDYYGILAASGTSRVWEARIPRRAPGPGSSPAGDPERAVPPPPAPAVPAARRRERARPETDGSVGERVASQTTAAAKRLPSADPAAAHDRSWLIEAKKKDSAAAADGDDDGDADDEGATSCYDATDAEASDAELTSFLDGRRRRLYGPPPPPPSAYAALGPMNPFAEAAAAPRAPSPVPVAVAMPVRRAPAEAPCAMELELPTGEGGTSVYAPWPLYAGERRMRD